MYDFDTVGEGCGTCGLWRFAVGSIVWRSECLNAHHELHFVKLAVAAVSFR